jgi:S-DNA-T family DNA segregation ATPase FtsK/SpoIIIE
MEGVVRFWEEQAYEGEKKTTPPPWERALTRAAILSQTDEMLEEAIRLVQQEGVASTSLLQRKLGVGYPRAGRIMDALFKLGIVGEEQGGGRTRNVLISKEADPISYIAENYKDF